MRPSQFHTLWLLGAILILHVGFAADAPQRGPDNEVVIQYAARRFQPAEVKVSAGEPVIMRVINLSRERIEFESFKLHVEKVVAPGESVAIRLPALKPGTYDFFDDFHDAVPEGKIFALAARH